MAIIVNQQDNRSELQKRIAAELTEKAKKKKASEAELPDGVEDSRYIEGTKTTTSLAWVWIVIAVVAVIALVAYFIVASGNNQ
jgi:type VI protein secretion system component VasF